MTVPDAPDARMMKLTLHYDGAGFAGWQVQRGARTVQGEVEAALARLTAGAARAVLAAGRTDAGVHATGQVVGAQVPAKWTPDALAKALNAVLPQDIWVAGAVEVGSDFHARYDAVARGYIYRVGTGEVAASPFLRRWCWPLRQPLRPEVLAEAALQFGGTHSFRAFAKAGQPERGEQCTVYRSEWRRWERAGLAYHVTANRFLHHMVRYLVGTMVDVARGRRPLADIGTLLRGVEGVETSPPAPPEGLYLTRVYYTPEELEDEPAHEAFP